MIRRDDTGVVTTVLRNLITPSPFSKPDTTNPRFIGIHLGSTNPDYSARGFRSSDLLIDNVWVPSRGQLTP